MRAPIVLALLLLAGSAHAMGSDRIKTVVAWNRDGSAALIEDTTFRDGDKSLGYTLIAAGKPTVAVTITMTTRDDGKDVEQKPATECIDAAKQLAAALVADRFDGVRVNPTACNGVRRQVVGVAAANAREVERSWVALPQGRPPTAREAASWAVANEVVPDYAPFVPTSSCDESRTTLDVANASGKLVLVITSWTCNTPTRDTVRAFVPKARAYAEQTD